MSATVRRPDAPPSAPPALGFLVAAAGGGLVAGLAALMYIGAVALVWLASIDRWFAYAMAVTVVVAFMLATVAGFRVYDEAVARRTRGRHAAEQRRKVLDVIAGPDHEPSSEDEARWRQFMTGRND